MTKTFLAALWLAAASVAAPAAAQDYAAAQNYAAAQDYAKERQEARGVVKQFAAALREALESAIESQDLEHAVGVCNTQVPEIAARLSREIGWTVARTALRLRNPNNAPGPEELAVLRDFEARVAAGEAMAGMEHAAVVDRDGKTALHYMKAIPVK